MPKRYFRKLTPNPEKLKQNRVLKILGEQIYEANLWHLNRKSVARAFLNGVFWAIIPMPLQMLAAALLAIPLKANIPLSLALVWITNPLTMPFVFFFNYKVGTLILGERGKKHFHLSIEWIWDKIEHIWLPLYVGSFVTAIVASLIAYFAIHVMWRMHVIKRWKERRQK
ncbi:DUF2062 domain-containing protein [Marinomonas epiphytica]